MIFIQSPRNSFEAMDILRRRPTAFALLYLIAQRAKRSEDHPNKNLEVGEAFIGDYESYGVTEQIYRDDKAFLTENGQITSKGTNRGTIAKIVSSTVFCINEKKGTDEKKKENGQRTTNNNDNNIINKIHTEKPLSSKKEYLTNIPESDIKHFVNLFQVSPEFVTRKGHALFEWCESNGKTKKNYKMFLSSCLRKDKDQTQPINLLKGGIKYEELDSNL